MSEAKRYKYHRVFDGYNFLSAQGEMEQIVGSDMELVSAEGYDALEADNAALREQVKAQSDSLLGQYRIVAEMQDRAITVERERDALRLKVQEYNSALDAMTARYVVLETLVKALPVLDMRFDSVAVGPLGWTVGGVTFGKVTEANAYSALLQYRATLAAQDAGKGVRNGL